MGTSFQKRVACTSLLLSFSMPAYPALSDNIGDGFENCRIASNEELDKMRGGFEVNFGGAQWLLALGIEQVTYINGVLSAMNTLNLSQFTLAAINQALGSGNTVSVPAPVSAPTPVQSPPANSGQVTTPPPPNPASPIHAPVPTSLNLTQSEQFSAPPPQPNMANSNPAPVAVATQPQNLNPVQVVQNGPGNTFTLPTSLNLPSTSAITTVIQNTLDNQVIQHMTILNATLANAELIRSMALSARLSQVLNRSLQ